MDLDNILKELEQKGIRNDEAQSDKALKYLNITRDTGEFLRVLVLATRSSKILEVGTSKRLLNHLVSFVYSPRWDCNYN